MCLSCLNKDAYAKLASSIRTVSALLALLDVPTALQLLLANNVLSQLLITTTDLAPVQADSSSPLPPSDIVGSVPTIP